MLKWVASVQAERRRTDGRPSPFPSCRPVIVAEACIPAQKTSMILWSQSGQGIGQYLRPIDCPSPVWCDEGRATRPLGSYSFTEMKKGSSMKRKNILKVVTATA